jgi:DNA-binding MarR family transcriptional regulator
MKSKTTPTDPASSDDVEAIVTVSVDAFRRVLRRLRVAARKTELATGLSAAQLFVLSAVADAPGCSVNDITHATMTDRSSVAAVIDRLVERGYVTRRQADSDRRRASIAITAKGRRAMQLAPPAPTALLISALRDLPAAQLRDLSTGLLALTRSMGIAEEPAGMLFDDAPTRAVRAAGEGTGRGRHTG